MENEWTPQGYASVTPALIVNGATRLIAFLCEVFDAETLNRSIDETGRIGHAEIRIGHGIIEVFDANEASSSHQNGLHVFVRDTDECYRRALKAGATSLYEPADMPYGERSAGVKDEFGNSWFIATFQRGKNRGYYD
ncbi:VOC family protein [Desmospora profundinema]|uniref:Glyoxalase superfamily protein PhnB n=1 Tax=Desmospora profundinema TaxID=1571184 RepID=A0ABU1IRU6_9BACL|nr:VOC family protein [Desmospora profundinema]MDR6227148.1 putative glyoxalase superfamily protein PhnB [Desmospora profundinema]